jgi:hypothetical protein
MNMVSSSTHLPRPERLPPTDSAAAQQSYRVHLHVVQWSSFMTAKLNPVEWGWKLHEDKFIPVALDSAIAPDDILNVVRCKCQPEAQKPCSSNVWSCCKHGLTCVAASKNCNGMSCENAEEVNVDCIEDEDDGHVEDEEEHSD